MLRWGYLLALWRLPFSLVDAVTYHHEPNWSSVATFGLAAVIYVANVLQHEQAPHPDIVPSLLGLNIFNPSLGKAARTMA